MEGMSRIWRKEYEKIGGVRLDAAVRNTQQNESKEQ